MIKAKDMDSGEMGALLAWYRDSGVTHVGTLEPVNQFEACQTNKSNRRPEQITKPNQTRADIVATAKNNGNANTKAPKPPTAQMPIEANQGDPKIAAKNAQDAQNLEALKEALADLQGCSLRVRATQLVFCDGNPTADIMLVGKAPSRDDDLQGLAFSGRAGALLDNMLKAIGLDRRHVYLANIVPWRPPGNRDPAPHEIDMCLPFLKRQIELVAPKLLITLGELATKSLLGEKASVGQLRGQWQNATIGTHKVQILASLHPEFLLKQPAQKRASWADLQQIRKAVLEQCPIS